ncbi:MULTISPECIES: PspC domain-containing protein [unclassified Leeuwenhoekiella]|uniref:PspC domain-containing protein n=1 Tax=unclassified Leeuwenhoekiella TaxID=2615029 RepID=UPI000C352AAF|nr:MULTISPECIES: PspC domain-containing protein [unclassified Leeuwenhoekiella]MAW93682.1 hypothetical protein [Leeuwenhoekiella sp.]MBA83094.1 hypothetical protein [Leeuwenhoekiella sp.]|tara:strand:- start:8191 stop:9915 length:1725 start_codon:yes stop_codon:yes gene_type:complete
MNKTININLAGLFFHIDENAYAKLQRYLEAIKRSFTDAQGRDEIIQDIEARIAELFTERIKTERQVIGLADVDEIINIMGQPEDYRLDEELFEDEPAKKQTYTRDSGKKLYRDTEKSYIGGVCAGLGHYFQIDAIWLRIALILLTIFSWGGFILIYIAFWIFVPEARTTSEILEMRGKPVNIDNIQRKVKEGFDSVAESVKNVDYVKYGNKAREGAGSVAGTLGRMIRFILKVFVKFIGILLILIGGSTLIALFVGLFTAGSLDFFGGSVADYVEMANTSGAPFWFLVILTFVAVGIPFFMLFYLGLRILVNTLKRLSLTAKLSLLGIWLVALITIAVLGVRQGISTAMEGESVTTEVLQIQPNDTLTVRMKTQNKYGAERYRSHSWKIRTDASGNKVIYNRDVDLSFQKSDSPEAKLIVKKIAQGSSYDDAQERAENVIYNFEIKDNTLLLDNFFVTELKNKFRDQQIDLIVAVPEGMTVFTDENIISYHRAWYADLMDRKFIGQYTLMQNSKLICTTCPPEEIEEDSNDWEYSETVEDSSVTNNPAEYKEEIAPDRDAVQVQETVTKQDSID